MNYEKKFHKVISLSYMRKIFEHNYMYLPLNETSSRDYLAQRKI